VEDDIQQRAVQVQSLQPTVVLNKTQPTELVHEETDPGTSGANHLCQRFLADLRKHRFWFTFFAEIGQQEKHARQPLLTGIEELIDQVSVAKSSWGYQVSSL
jgi:hypothetical protein